MEELTQPRDSKDISAARRQMLRAIFQETLAAIDVRNVLSRTVSCEQGVLQIADLRYRLTDYGRVLVISIGKAAVPCAEILLAALAGNEIPVQAIVAGPGDMGNAVCRFSDGREAILFRTRVHVTRRSTSSPR